MEIKSRSQLHKLLPPNAVIAEIGVAEGLFAQEIYSWAPSLLYLVDLWESDPSFPGDAGSSQEWHNINFGQVKENFKHKDDVIILRGPSVRMANSVPDHSCDLVYIDACHSYECVKYDIQAWKSKVKPGGYIAFHDMLNEAYGVNQAVYEFGREIGKQVVIIHETQQCDAGAYIRL